MWHKKETNPRTNVILMVDIELTVAIPHPPPKVYSIPHKISLLNPANHNRRLCCGGLRTVWRHWEACLLRTDSQSQTTLTFVLTMLLLKKIYIYVLCFPNNKPHITMEADTSTSKKKLAFKNSDSAGAASHANGTKPPTQTIKRTTLLRCWTELNLWGQ